MSKDDVIGLAGSGAPIEQKTKATDAAAATTGELISAFRQKAIDTKLISGNDPFSAHYVAGQEGKPGMFAFIVRKDLVKAESTKTIGLGEKVTTRKIVKWDPVPAETMKMLDPEGKKEPAELQEIIRKKAKVGTLTGIEMATVSGDWENGFIITNLVEGASRSKVFGEKHGLADAEESKANILLLVREDKLREALGAKKEEKQSVSEAQLEPEPDFAALRQAAAMEKQAPGEIREDNNGIPIRIEGASGSFWSKLNPFGGRGKGSGGAAKG